MKNFTEKMKRFWSLQKKTNGGFTLVELIVVIAILAILAGIAVPAYSGYVEKANKQADMTLVSDIADALQLHYYDNGMSGSGYVIIYPKGTDGTTANNFGDVAMKKVFGDGWKEAVALQYDGWTSGGMSSIAFSQGYFAGFVGTSSYLTGGTPESLLDNVTDLTFSATGLFNTMNPDTKYNVILSKLFGGNQDNLENYCKQFGITTSEDDLGNMIFADNVTDAQLANLLVFGAAQQIGEGNTSGDVTGLVQIYAGYAGFVNSQAGNTSIQEAYQTLNSELMSDVNGDGEIGSADINMAFDNFKNNTAVKSGLTTYLADESQVKAMDDIAFQCIMQAVTEAAEGVTPEEMADADFFSTSEKVTDYFDTYIAAADFVGEIAESDPEMGEKIANAIATGGIVVFLYEGPIVDCSVNGVINY